MTSLLYAVKYQKLSTLIPSHVFFACRFDNSGADGVRNYM